MIASRGDFYPGDAWDPCPSGLPVCFGENQPYVGSGSSASMAGSPEETLVCYVSDPNTLCLFSLVTTQKPSFH